METTQIAFKGIERVNRGIYCNDKACEEIINLRQEGNVWRIVGDKLLHKDIQGVVKQSSEEETATIYDIYIHTASKHKFCIVHQEFQGLETISLYGINSNGMAVILDLDPILYQKQFGEEIVSISSLNNVLIVCTTQQKLYYVWKDEKYINVSINLDNNGVLKANVYQDLNEDNTRKIHTYDSFQWSVVYDSALMIRDTYTNLLKASREFGLYSGLSFFRYAVKMFDGSYLYYSNIDFADTNGDKGDANGSDINNLVFTLIGKHEANNTKSYKIGSCINNLGHHIIDIDFSNLSNIKELLDLNIITSIDVYMTRPILQIDLDCEKTELKSCSDLGMNNINYTNSGANYTIYYLRNPINKTAVLDQITNGIFYKVKSFGKDAVNKAVNSNVNKLTAEILYKDIETLTSNETLVTDNGRNEVLFKDTYTYNKKQHIYDLVYNIFNGYTYPKGGGSTDPNALSFQRICSAIGVVGGTMYAMVKGRYNNQNFAVKIAITEPLRHLGYKYNFMTLQYRLRFYEPRLFIYPNMEGFELNVFISNGIDSKLIYKKGSDEIAFINNFGYIAKLYEDNNVKDYFNSSIYARAGSDTIAGYVIDNGVGYQAITESNLKMSVLTLNIPTLPIFDETIIRQIYLKNVLQLTETDNPFIYPAKNNYSFGEQLTIILSVQSTVGQITETKFGLYPLYVFTDMGIYTMGVGEGEIAYANIIPINSQTITNKQTINIGNAIMYLADNGLNIIQGRETKLLSELVKGKPDSKNIIATFFDKAKSIFGFKDNDISKEGFLEEVKDAIITYDSSRNEVIFSLEHYSYVYSGNNNYFAKITDTFDSSYTTSNEVVLGREGGHTIWLYGVDRESNDILKRALIVTKPFNLGTRQYKKISRFILSMTIEKVSFRNAPANAEVWVFGTNNMVDYVPYKNMAVAYEKDIQDIHISRFFKSFNYAVLVIATKQSECDISGASFEYDIVRGKTGQR